MLRRPAVLLLISAGMHLTAHAQETAIRSSDGDSLRYSYTPLPPQAPEKRPFLRRVVDYFGESTTDKTFEKKIDFTFAGGPSYSKNTSFGIGLLATAGFAYAAIEKQQPPFVMPWQIPVVAFAVIQLICMVAALLGIIRLSLYEPAMVFRA